MKIVSVNVGMPREVLWKGMTVQTAIFKELVAGSVRIGKLNLAGDQQADLTVHGGRGEGGLRVSGGALRVLAEGAAGGAVLVGQVR